MKTHSWNSTSKHGPLGGSRSGGVLALAMIVVLTIAALAAGMLQLSGAVTRRQTSAVNTKLSFYMAEAGLTEAYAGLSSGRTGNVGTEADPVSFGEGLFWVEATENPDGTTTLESTGMTGNGRAVLSFVVERETSSVASLRMFAADGIRVGPGVTIDSFDSHALEDPEAALLAEKPIGPQTAGLGGLSSNGPIIIRGTEAAPVLIDGDVTAGPEQNLEVVGAVDITGVEGTAMAATQLPPVETPDIPLGQALLVDDWVPHTILPGEAGLRSLVVAANSEVIVQGPATLLLGQLNLKPAGKLTLDATAGEIKIFVLGDLRLEPGSFLETVAEDALGVSIQVPAATPEPIMLAAASEFAGAFYAPQSDVMIFEQFEVFGSMVGKTLDLNGSVKMHYDVQLDVAASQQGLPELVSWRIVELSNPSSAVSMDPFQLLGVDRDLLRKPAVAHEDQVIQIKFKIANGTWLSYSGPESLFEWSVVVEVGSLFRDGVEVDADAAQKRQIERESLARDLAI